MRYSSNDNFYSSAPFVYFLFFYKKEKRKECLQINASITNGGKERNASITNGGDVVFRVSEPPILSRFATIPATSSLSRLFPSLSRAPLLSFSLTPNPSCPLSELSLSSEHGSWVPFDPVGEQAVETAHAAGHSSAQSSFFNPRLKKNIVYHYDLTKMQQVKTSSTNDYCGSCTVSSCKFVCGRLARVSVL